MTDPLGALERSLRDGPPDESGYRVGRRELEIGIGALTVDGITPVQGVVPTLRARRGLSLAPRTPMVALLVAVIAVGGVVLATRNGQPVVGPPASSTPGPGVTSTASQIPSPSASSSAGPSASGLPGGSAIPVPPLTQSFVSTRNGFSVSYPAGWTATPATRSWPPDTYTQLGSPTLDELKLAGQVRLIVASQRLGAGQTEAQWVAAYFRPFVGGDVCPTASALAASPRLPIDGRSGYLDIAGCPASSNDPAISPRDVVFEAFVFSSDRVYQVVLDGDVDLAYFQTLLATMRLDPSSAIDPGG